MTAVSVKVPRPKLIAALQASLDKERTKATVTQFQEARKVSEAQYGVDLLKWGKAVAKVIARDGARDVSHSSYNDTIHFGVLGLELPAKPKEANPKLEVQDQSKVRNLENAITILNLSEEDFVNASTYKSVVQYL